MFRQIVVDERDQNFQCILWRFEADVRTLLQLDSDYEHECPVASQIIKKEMYSDKLFSGAHSISEATVKQQELITLFKQGCLNLRKWISNEAKALDFLSADMLALYFKTLFASASSVYLLGM